MAFAHFWVTSSLLPFDHWTGPQVDLFLRGSCGVPHRSLLSQPEGYGWKLGLWAARTDKTLGRRNTLWYCRKAYSRQPCVCLVWGGSSCLLVSIMKKRNANNATTTYLFVVWVSLFLLVSIMKRKETPAMQQTCDLCFGKFMFIFLFSIVKANEAPPATCFFWVWGRRFWSRGRERATGLLAEGAAEGRLWEPQLLAQHGLVDLELS